MLLGPAAVPETYAAARSGAIVISSIRIDNFGRVNDQYYRGAHPKGHDYADLAALGIKTLIDLTDGDADRPRCTEWCTTTGHRIWPSRR
jgi:hypothetical protein